ncbi:hypothetical protein [Hymenobacter sp. AT01-02]|uniref:hypothetical protein n=1 Tax=Hymenobacter sp. AT01-02 TaxID=1571877 RepID=UPI0006E3AA32|nr:hypothetical protein [Hymenobacter sp. AT01-02]
MSVEFLSDKQADGFGCFHAAPRPEQLSQFFDLRPANQTLLATRWRPANKAGMWRPAVHLALPGYVSA